MNYFYYCKFCVISSYHQFNGFHKLDFVTRWMKFLSFKKILQACICIVLNGYSYSFRIIYHINKDKRELTLNQYATINKLFLSRQFIRVTIRFRLVFFLRTNRPNTWLNGTRVLYLNGWKYKLRFIEVNAWHVSWVHFYWERGFSFYMIMSHKKYTKYFEIRFWIGF